MTCDNKLMRETEPGAKILKWYLHFTRRRDMKTYYVHVYHVMTSSLTNSSFQNKCTGKIRQTNARYNNQLVRRSQGF